MPKESKESLLPPQKIREVFDYDCKILTWKIKHARNIRIGTAAGTLGNHGYLQTMVCGKLYLNHRLIFAWVHGRWPEEIDHINHTRTDNRIENLREVTHAENGRNQKMRKNNTSGFLGIGWSEANQKWRAYIQVAGAHIHLGYFIKLQDALTARKRANIKYGFATGHGDPLKG